MTNNLKDMIINSSNLYSDKVAVISKNNEDKFIEITYKEMHEDIKNLATEFINKGYQGKNIAITGKNSYEWILVYLSCLYMGAVPVPVDRLLKEKDIELSINRLDADALFYSDEMEDVISKTNLNCNKIKMQESITDLLLSGKKSIKNGNMEAINYKVDKNNLASMFFTSGTTAISKIVMLSHNNIMSCMNSGNKMVNVTNNDRALSVLPLHHTLECNFGFCAVILNGGTVVFNDKLENFGTNLKEYKPTMLLLVPKVLEKMKETIETEVEKMNMSKLIDNSMKIMKHIKITKLRRLVYKKIIDNFGGNLHTIMTGGAALSSELIDFFETIGIKIIQGYGLTESAPLVAINPANSRNNDKVGKVIDVTKVKIINQDENGVGELCIKGDPIMLGYYNDEEATKEAFDDEGYLKTGDLMSIDEKNFLTIHGRSKNLIITSNGENVSPEELEEHIYKNKLIKDVIVCAEKVDNKDVIMAKIVLNDELTSKIKENVKFKNEIVDVIKKYIEEINSNMPAYKCIKAIEIKDEDFDKTSLQKVKRYS